MLAIGDGWFNLTKAFFQLAVFRTSVQVLTVISGYLLFKSCIDQEPVCCLTKKARTILIPFLCFNLPLAPVALGAEMHFRMEDTTYLRLAAPFLLWPATAWAARTRFGTWLAGMSKYASSCSWGMHRY
jgi:fucose 4-O-acetylase-like acetyltransferase